MLRTLTAVALALFMLIGVTGPALAGMPRPRATIHRSVDVPCGGALACTSGSEIWIAPTAGRIALAHELGHVFWSNVATASDRVWMQRMLGFPAVTPWYNGTWPAGLDSPDEHAADAYATCDQGMRPNGRWWGSAYGYDPTPARHRVICNAIVVIGLVRAHSR